MPCQPRWTMAIVHANVATVEVPYFPLFKCHCLLRSTWIFYWEPPEVCSVRLGAPRHQRIFFQHYSLLFSSFKYFHYSKGILAAATHTAKMHDGGPLQWLPARPDNMPLFRQLCETLDGMACIQDGFWKNTQLHIWIQPSSQTEHHFKVADEKVKKKWIHRRICQCHEDVCCRLIHSMDGEIFCTDAK